MGAYVFLRKCVKTLGDFDLILLFHKGVTRKRVDTGV